jgi:hypothetical protein
MFNILENLLAVNKNEVNPTINVDMSERTNTGDTYNIEKIEVKPETHNTYNQIALPQMDEAALVRVLRALCGGHQGFAVSQSALVQNGDENVEREVPGDPLGTPPDEFHR